MDQLVTHPLFGYRVSYRRVLEIQARLLARVVTGEIAAYPGFETR
jgi:CRISPR-associated protein Cas1